MSITKRAACAAALATLLMGPAGSVGAGPAQAAEAPIRHVGTTADDSVLQVGETRSVRVQLGSRARQCHSVLYGIRQVDATHVRLTYDYYNLCGRRIKIAWQTRNERYPGDGAGGARRDRGFECYTCRRLRGSVRLYDPRGIQRFEAATLYLGITGTNIIGDIPLGAVFRA